MLRTRATNRTLRGTQTGSYWMSHSLAPIVPPLSDRLFLQEKLWRQCSPFNLAFSWIGSLQFTEELLTFPTVCTSLPQHTHRVPRDVKFTAALPLIIASGTSKRPYGVLLTPKIWEALLPCNDLHCSPASTGTPLCFENCADLAPIMAPSYCPFIECYLFIARGTLHHASPKSCRILRSMVKF